MNSAILLRMKSIYRDLSKKDKAIADYILEQSHDIRDMSISELADKTGVAVSTVYQFSKKMGYQGYKDFRLALLTEERLGHTSIHEAIGDDDDELQIAVKVFDSNIQTIRDSKALLDIHNLQKAKQIILNAGCLSFFGMGASNAVAEDGFHKFLRSPVNCQHSFDYHNQLIMASLMSPKDAAILISHSGVTMEMVQIAATVKKRGGKLIAITSYPYSEIAKMADAVFISMAEETAYRSEALSSRITQLTIIDALYIITMFDNEDLSEKTLVRVRDVISRSKNRKNEKQD